MPHSNKFISHLSELQRAMIIDRCKSITLVNDQELNTVGMPIERVYFPITGFVSLTTEIIDDKNIEIGLIGSEGMLGASLALGNKNAPIKSTVRGSGSALCMDADLFVDLVTRYPPIRKLILNYLYVLIQQLAQTSACNKFHAVKNRLAYWLLITQDRTHGKNLNLTHDLLAKMLGVRRSAITIAAGLMMQQGTISYSRGKIIVLSREALENASCSCYSYAIHTYNKTIIKL